MPVATLVDQPEHRQGMNDIEMNNIEKEGDYLPYKSIYGQSSCMNQAWSAAAIYDVLLGLTIPAFPTALT